MFDFFSELRKIWGYGFDDQDYCQMAKPDNLRHNSKIFDLWTTSVLNGKSRDYGARPICWTTCEESLLIDDQSAPASPIVFFGRKTRDAGQAKRTSRPSSSASTCPPAPSFCRVFRYGAHRVPSCGSVGEDVSPGAEAPRPPLSNSAATASASPMPPSPTA